MAEVEELTKISVAVRSKILEAIQLSLDRGLAAETMYTKSDGTNYGMYQKAGDLATLGDIYEQVFSGGVTRAALPGGPASPELLK